MEATPKLGAKLKDTSQKLFGFKAYLSFSRFYKIQNQQVFFLSQSSLLTFNPRYIAFASGYQAIHKAQAFLLQFRTSRKPISCVQKKALKNCGHLVVEFAPIWSIILMLIPFENFA